MNSVEALKVLATAVEQCLATMPPKERKTFQKQSSKALSTMIDMQDACVKLAEAHDRRKAVWAETMPGDGTPRRLGESKPDPERRAAGNARAAALRRVMRLGKEAAS